MLQTALTYLLVYTSAAFLISMFWIGYLKRIHVFKSAPYLKWFIVFGIGMLTPLPILFFGHLLPHWSFLNYPYNSIAYYIVNVGFVEEGLKILPILLTTKYVCKANEPLDYVVHASLLALGFSASENILYFIRYGEDIIVARGTLAATGHMIFSGIAATGILYSQYKTKKIKWQYIVLFLSMAAILHGVFDLILEFHFGFFVFIAFYLVILELWSDILNNALNFSPSFSKKITLNNTHIYNYVWKGVLGITLLEVIATSMLNKDSSFELLLVTQLGQFVMFGFIYMVYALRLSNFKLIPQWWFPLVPGLPFTIKSGMFDPSQNGFGLQVKGANHNDHVLSSWLNTPVMVFPVSKSAVKVQAVTGFLTDKVYIRDQEYFIFTPHKTITVDGISLTRLCLLLKSGDPILVAEKYPIVYLLKALPNRNSNNIDKNLFIQWGAVLPEQDFLKKQV